MGLWRRVALTAIVLAAASALMVIAVLSAVHRSNDATREASMRWGPANADAQALLAHVVDQETGERGFLITRNPAYLQPYAHGRTAAVRDIATLRELARGDEQIETALHRVSASLHDWQQDAAAEIAARRSGSADAQLLVRSSVGKRLFDSVRGNIATVQRLIDGRRADAQDRVSAANQSLETWLWLTVATAAVVAVGMILAMAMWVFRPLRQLSAALRRVTAGDIAADVEVAGPPEFVAVASDADAMRRRILHELERSEAARQALEQRGSVVLGLSQLLSPTTNHPVPGLRYSTVLQPAVGYLAGDWVDVLALGDDRVGLVLLDVSGHGAAAGLEALRLKHVLTTALQYRRPPHEAFATAAAGFTEDERFATAIIVVLDVVTGELRWANAGHLSPRIVPMNGQQVTPEDLVPLEPTGPLLSSFTSGWTTRSGRLEVGEMILAFSDGLTEARDEQGREFGLRGICAALSQTTVRDVDTAVSVCLAAGRAHAVNSHRDDMTVIAVARDPSTVVAREHDPAGSGDRAETG